MSSMREVLKAYKAAHKILFGVDLTSVSLSEKVFNAFLTETIGNLDNVVIVTNAFTVDNVHVLKSQGPPPAVG